MPLIEISPFSPCKSRGCDSQCIPATTLRRVCEKFAALVVILGTGMAISGSPAALQAAGPAPFELKDHDQVLFLGSEFVEQDIKHNLLEGALSSHWPQRKVTFRNLGWAGDDPTAVARGYFGGAEEGYRRLLEELDRLKPTVIFVCYGSTSANIRPDGLPTFAAQYQKLLGDLKKHTDRIVLVSPPPAEQLPAPFPDMTEVNVARQLYGNHIRAVAAEQNLRFIDLFEPVSAGMKAEQAPVTTDCIRFNDRGYLLASNAILQQLGLPQVSKESPDAELLDLIRVKNELFFHRYRPQNETYLRGFRKHEQGQNAKEISEFDPLIEREEERISAHLNHLPLPERIPQAALPPLEFKPLTPEQQQKEFTLDEGLEIRPFAWEPMIANPIHMNFDSRGRLWIASSPIYPQLRPGAAPNDQIIVLEDTDGDNIADKRTVFAEGLLIPTAILPDEQGGAYVANSTELLYLKDRDGDGKADERYVLLSGFGTEDTHHILHTFRWSPDALLNFNQSIYIHSHLETPQGMRTMLGSGIWRFRKGTGRTEPVAYGMINPWGHAYDVWGQEFATDGASSGQGLHYVFPGAAFDTAVGYNRVLKGLSTGQPKHCGLERISGRHFPEAWQGSYVTADFRGNRINRFQLTELNSGYAATQMDDVLTCRDRAFRPVDLKLAPDGSLYIADWHDSIINHGEVDFRDPRRDDRHGRIWRITFAGRKPAPRPELEQASISQLLDLLRSPEQWTRQMARVQLTLRDQSAARAAVSQFVAGLATSDPDFEHLRVEALWVQQALNQVDPELLQAVLASKDHHARAAAVRVLSQSISEDYGLPANFSQLNLLAVAVADAHPQVRLEAINALRAQGSAEAVDLAMRALNQPTDTNIDFALYITLRDRQSLWLPRLEAGEAEFSQNLEHTLYALNAIDNSAALAPLMQRLTADQIPQDKLSSVLNTLGKFAGPAEARTLFERAISHPNERSALLNTLAGAAQKRNIIPTGDLNGLESLLSDPAGLKLAGLWNRKEFQPKLVSVAEDDKQPLALRRAAMEGLAGLKEKGLLEKYAGNAASPLNVRCLAIISLLPLDSKSAARQAADILSQAKVDDEQQLGSMLDHLIGAKTGPNDLAAALKDHQLDSQLATLVVRKAESAGQRAGGLISALRTAGKLAATPRKLTPQELEGILNQVATRGDARRGEAIYRRKELTCITCHSIGGAGGQVGPDMLSLGASSPVDYIVQSLLEPSAKIKEGYHTVTVSTVDGKVFNGIMVREGSDELVLRDAQNREFTIPKSEIDDRINSPTSMMPADLVSKLPRDEFADLVTFLSTLGKEGPFKVPQNRFVRRWLSNDGMTWLSQVDGSLPLNDVPGKTVKFEIQVTSPGQIGLKFNSLEGLRITRGDQKDNLRSNPIVFDAPVGRETFQVVQHGKRTEPLSVEIVEIPGSTGRAELVNR